MPGTLPGCGERVPARPGPSSLACVVAVLEEAEVPRHYRAHALRHTFASLLADHGVSPWTIRDLLGHRDVTTTQLYVQLRERHLVEVDRLDVSV